MGGLAQLGEHLLCKQGVVGSIPSSSTNPGLFGANQSIQGVPEGAVWVFWFAVERHAVVL